MNNENGNGQRDWQRDLKIMRIALFGKDVAKEIEDGTLYDKVKQRVTDGDGTLSEMTHLCGSCNLLIWNSEPRTHIHSKKVECTRILSEEDLTEIIKRHDQKEDS